MLNPFLLSPSFKQRPPPTPSRRRHSFDLTAVQEPDNITVQTLASSPGGTVSIMATSRYKIANMVVPGQDTNGLPKLMQDYCISNCTWTARNGQVVQSVLTSSGADCSGKGEGEQEEGGGVLADAISRNLPAYFFKEYNRALGAKSENESEDTATAAPALKTAYDQVKLSFNDVENVASTAGVFLFPKEKHMLLHDLGNVTVLIVRLDNCTCKFTIEEVSTTETGGKIGFIGGRRRSGKDPHIVSMLQSPTDIMIVIASAEVMDSVDTKEGLLDKIFKKKKVRLSNDTIMKEIMKEAKDYMLASDKDFKGGSLTIGINAEV